MPSPPREAPQRDTSRPPAHRYETIAEEIRGTIARGAYGPDGRLPSERWFGKSFGAQRNTVRQALGLLEREGRIVAVGKSGWFVTAAPGAASDSLAREASPPKTPRRDAPVAAEGRVLFVKFQRPLGMTVDRLVSGLGEVLADDGVPLLRFDSAEYEEARHVATIEELTTVDARGIVLWPHASMDRAMLARLQALTPLILVDRRVYGFESDSVIFEDLRAGREITEHLLGLGHRRIAFFGDEPFVESVQNRLRGFRRALEAAGITPDDRLIVLVNGHFEPTFTENVRLLLRGGERPTAIVCANDAVASAVYLVLRGEGLRVPQDIALTGFGNDSAGFLDVIGLTTMAQPFVELGREAGRLLLRRLAESATAENREPREITLPMRLVVRSSSGPPR